MSVTYGFLNINAALLLPRFGDYWEWEDGLKAAKVLFWLLLYIPGVSVGLAGLLSLVAETIHSNQKVLVITVVFGSATLALTIISGLVACCIMSGNGSSDTILGPILGSSLAACGVALGCFGVLGAFYSDWILGAIADNVWGAPSGDSTYLYWSYFIAKRLPLFSS